MNKITLLYSRTSLRGAQLSGLEAQNRALEVYCKNNGIKNYKLLSDEGISGAKSSRPALDELMELCKSEQVSTVIVFSFSRFARSTVHLLEALNFFHEHNIAFISLSEKLDTSTAMGRAVFTIISAISQLERELISERVKNGLKNAAAKGKQIGRPKTVNTKLIKELLLQENYTYEKIAELANCGSSSVGRIARNIKTQKAV